MSTLFVDKTKMFLYFFQVSVCNAVCGFFFVFFNLCAGGEYPKAARLHNSR